MKVPFGSRSQHIGDCVERLVVSLYQDLGVEKEAAELLNHRELIVEGEGVGEDDDVRTEIGRSAAQRQNFFVVSFTDNANG